MGDYDQVINVVSSQLPSSSAQSTGERKTGFLSLCSTDLDWLVLCVDLIQAGVIREDGASTEEMPSWAPAIRHFLN